MRLTERRYSFGPIEAICVERGAESLGEMAQLLRTDYRNICRGRHNGVGFWQADVLAVRLGSHPACLWPAWRDDSCACSEAEGDAREAKRLRYHANKAQTAA